MFDDYDRWLDEEAGKMFATSLGVSRIERAKKVSYSSAANYADAW